MIKLIKAVGKVFGYVVEALRPLNEAERKEAGMITASEYQAMKNEHARQQAEKDGDKMLLEALKSTVGMLECAGACVPEYRKIIEAAEWVEVSE